MSISYPDACLDPNLFGPWFAGESWATWRLIDRAIFGLPTPKEDLPAFAELAGNREPPTQPVRECWIIAGRRAGKDLKAASLVVYLATIGVEVYGWRKHLVPGEIGVVQLLAVDREQAAICLSYVKAFFRQPLLATLIRRETADTIELTNGFEITITTSDPRRVRGRTVCAAVFDEVAHWRSETSTAPDVEVYRAVRPAMLTMPNSLLIGISSPHMQRGLLYEKCQAHYGKSGRVLVVRAPTWTLNPNVSRTEGEIAEAFDSDPQWAAAEYGAEWRRDLAAFISREALDAITSRERERPPQRDLSYVAFIDMSSGVNDSSALCVAHLEGKTAVIDCLREVPAPHSPGQAIEEFCRVLQRYGIWTVYGDKYAIGFTRELLSQRNISFVECESSKSELYIDFLTMVNTRAVSLLDNDRCERQLFGLERRVRHSSRDSVDHARGAHDDLANVCAGAAVMALKHGAVIPAQHLQSCAIGAEWDPTATPEENLSAMARAEARLGYFTGPGWAPTWRDAGRGTGHYAQTIADEG